jgi:hypothetical protein
MYGKHCDIYASFRESREEFCRKRTMKCREAARQISGFRHASIDYAFEELA